MTSVSWIVDHFLDSVIVQRRFQSFVAVTDFTGMSRIKGYHLIKLRHVVSPHIQP